MSKKIAQSKFSKLNISPRKACKFSTSFLQRLNKTNFKKKLTILSKKGWLVWTQIFTLVTKIYPKTTPVCQFYPRYPWHLANLLDICLINDIRLINIKRRCWVDFSRLHGCEPLLSESPAIILTPQLSATQVSEREPTEELFAIIFHS